MVGVIEGVDVEEVGKVGGVAVAEDGDEDKDEAEAEILF